MLIKPGEPAPWFATASTQTSKFLFDSVAGRYVVLSFLKSAQEKSSQKVLEDLMRHRILFDDEACCFFGVSTDLEDQQFSRLQAQIPGIRFFWDFDQRVSQAYGVINQNNEYQQCTYILDERLRVLGVLPFTTQPENHMPQLIQILTRLPQLAPPQPASVQAPVLVVPRVFELELCQALMAHYHQHGGQDSGFMREENGKTIPVYDHGFKRRQDQTIVDQDLLKAAMYRVHDRLAPEIHKAFQFQATRIERHIVACYDSQSGGFFRAHRDNTTKGTAHRRFAVSLNLNTGDYEGGLLRFPEFGRQTYMAPAGGAVVFSCSLLHEATPVTQGIRYAYLPFLYDDAAAKIREENLQFLREDRQKTSGESEPVKSSDEAN